MQPMSTASQPITSNTFMQRAHTRTQSCQCCTLLCWLISYLCLHTICRHVSAEYLWVYTTQHTSKTPSSSAHRLPQFPPKLKPTPYVAFKCKNNNRLSMYQNNIFPNHVKSKTIRFCGFIAWFCCE